MVSSSWLLYEIAGQQICGNMHLMLWCICAWHGQACTNIHTQTFTHTYTFNIHTHMELFASWEIYVTWKLLDSWSACAYEHGAGCQLGCTCDMKAVGQLRCICMYMCWGSCWTAGMNAYTNMKLFVSWGAHVMWKLLCSWGNTHTHSSEAAHACKVGTWAGKAFFHTSNCSLVLSIRG